MRERKIFFLIITLIFFCSCGSRSPGGEASLPSPSPGAFPGRSSNGQAEAGSNPGGQQSEFETVIMMYYGGEAESDPLSDAVLEKFKLAVRLVPYPEDYAQLLSCLMADPPDIFKLALSPARLAELTAGGFIREIPDEFIAQNTNLLAYIQSNGMAQANRKIYNAYAYIPCDYDVNPAYAADSARFFYRKDWAETLSLPIPQNPGELYSMLREFAAQQNPNRSDGSALLGMAADSPKQFAALYGYDLDGWTEEDGRYVPSYYANGFLPVLNYARRLHDEGLMRFIRDAGEAADLNSAGILVSAADDAEALFHLIEPVAERLNISVEEALSGHVGVMPVPRDPDAAEVWGNAYLAEGWLAGRHVTDTTLKKLMEFFDYTLTDSARVLERYGLPGVTCSQTDDGIFMFTDPETYAPYDLAAIYPTGGFLNMLTADAARYADANYPSAIPYTVRSFFDDAVKMYHTPAKAEDMLCRCVNSPLRDAFAADYEERFYKIITGTEPVDAMFEQFRDACRQMGIEAVIEEVNAAINQQ